MEKYDDLMQKYDLKNVLELVFEYATEINKYINDTTPWQLDENTEKEKIAEILYNLLYHLRRVAIMLLPFFTEKMEELLARIATPYQKNISLSENEGLPRLHEARGAAVTSHDHFRVRLWIVRALAKQSTSSRITQE